MHEKRGYKIIISVSEGDIVLVRKVYPFGLALKGKERIIHNENM